jgi:ATP-dependent Clp protease ATP-binding subunit ClpX
MRLFELEGIQLHIEDEVLDFMVEKAVEYKLGARGLRSICESILTDAMFELPSSKEKYLYLDMEYASANLIRAR